MNVKLAKTAGFCFGVKRAVTLVYATIEREGAKPPSKRKDIYTYGPIIHNDNVVKDLEEKGVKVINNSDEFDKLKDCVIIIRSHGTGKATYEKLDRLGIEIVDASCPNVRRIQRLVSEHDDPTEEILIVGDPTHPEVMGIIEWAGEKVHIVASIEEAEKFSSKSVKKLFVVAQTTFNIDKFKVILEILRKKGYYVNVINTICNATFERQTEAKELAAESDFMIVVGGKSSSNTKKLYEICKSECQNTCFIQTVDDLSFKSDAAIANVGITAGASTPNDIIEEVLTYVRNEF